MSTTDQDDLLQELDNCEAAVHAKALLDALETAAMTENATDFWTNIEDACDELKWLRESLHDLKRLRGDDDS